MWKKCKVCGSNFECYDEEETNSHYRRRRPPYKRPRKSVTCGTKCSKIFDRTMRHRQGKPYVMSSDVKRILHPQESIIK